jgi:RimJ/RimL family protein N-acetyltransferase
MAGSNADPSWLKIERAVPRLHGERVLLREWVPDDLRPFAALNADPRVMEYYPSPLTRAQSDAFVRERIVPQFAGLGFGLWAVEVPDVAPFVGYVGLDVPRFEADFTPCVEIGWRLAFTHWGKGYATEAARVAIAFGFAEAELEEIVSFTVPENHRSIAVMRRLGMDYVGDFDHPNLPAAHPLRRHVLYRLRPAGTFDHSCRQRSRLRP